MQTETFNPTLSIIIPCANAAKHLLTTIRSIEKQTMSVKEMDIILIDDASTDATMAIMKDFADRYTDNVTILSHKDKAGIGSACNLAVTYAQGEYVTFLYGGDFLEEDACERMVSLARKNELDILQTVYRKVYPDESTEIVEGTTMFGAFNLTDTELRKEFLVRDVMTLECRNKLFRRELLIHTRSSFAEGIGYEESKFIYPLFLTADKVGTANLITHNVRVYEEAVRENVWERNHVWLERPKFEMQLLLWLKQRPALFTVYKDEIHYNFFRKFYLEPIYIASTTDDPITGYDYEWMRVVILSELEGEDNPYMNGGDLAILIKNLGHSFLEDDVALGEYMDKIALTFEKGISA